MEQSQGKPDTRTRIRDAATVLFRRDGYSGTGLKRIATEAEAPFGSIYHFFPGGKQQLAEETIRTSGVAYGQMVLTLLDSVPDPVESVVHAFQVAADNLAATDYADACPIATVALEVASTNEVLRVATAEIFAGWVSASEQWFARWVPDQNAARSLACTMIMILEGRSYYLGPPGTRSPWGWPADRWPSCYAQPSSRPAGPEFRKRDRPTPAWVSGMGPH